MFLILILVTLELEEYPIGDQDEESSMTIDHYFRIDIFTAAIDFQL